MEGPRPPAPFRRPLAQPLPGQYLVHLPYCIGLWQKYDKNFFDKQASTKTNNSRIAKLQCKQTLLLPYPNQQ